MNNLRPLPPYGGEVAREQMHGRHPDVVVYGGPFAHQLAEHRRKRFGLGSAIVVPHGRHAREFRWPTLDRVAVAAPGLDVEALHRLETAVRATCARTPASVQ